MRVASRARTMRGARVRSKPWLNCYDYHEDVRRLENLLAVQHTSIRIACSRMPAPLAEPALTRPRLSFSASPFATLPYASRTFKRTNHVVHIVENRLEVLSPLGTAPLPAKFLVIAYHGRLPFQAWEIKQTWLISRQMDLRFWKLGSGSTRWITFCRRAAPTGPDGYCNNWPCTRAARRALIFPLPPQLRTKTRFLPKRRLPSPAARKWSAGSRVWSAGMR